MVMFMIKGELYKLLRSKSVKVLFILLLVLNSLQIIYVNYQNIYGDINTGKRKHLCYIIEKERFYAKPIDRSYLNAIIKTNI